MRLGLVAVVAVAVAVVVVVVVVVSISAIVLTLRRVHPLVSKAFESVVAAAATAASLRNTVAADTDTTATVGTLAAAEVVERGGVRGGTGRSA